MVLFNLSGHGHFDMSAYAAYFAGELEDLEMPAEEARLGAGAPPEAPALA